MYFTMVNGVRSEIQTGTMRKLLFSVEVLALGKLSMPD